MSNSSFSDVSNNEHVSTESKDRRTRRTRRQLKDALFALILEKGYDAVTVEDITGRADLGRTTFYLHYRDKEALLVESMETIANDLIERLPASAWRITDGSEPPSGLVRDAIQITFQHAADNAQLYRVLLRGEGANSATRRLHNIIAQRASELIQLRISMGELPLRPLVPVEVFSNYIASSLLGLVRWWLEDGASYSPEEMANMFRLLFFQGGRKALGM